MIVSRLIELLQDCDPDAEVRIAMQQSWPFECAIDGVAARDEFSQGDCECERWPHDPECPAINEPEYGEGLADNDVFIVEGHQERYGSKDAWLVSRSGQPPAATTHAPSAESRGRSCRRRGPRERSGSTRRSEIVAPAS